MPGLKGTLLGLGNPLLDVSSTVDQAFLDKYQVTPTHLYWPTSGHTIPYSRTNCGAFRLRILLLLLK